MQFVIPFSGHENIRSLHEKTIEITKDENLTPSGDCIIGVNAKFGCKGIPKKMKEKLKDPNSIVKFSIRVGEYEFHVKGKGHKKISCTHPNDIVLRKSDYVCPRTLAINCNKASDSIPRNIIKHLQNPKTKGIFLIEVV